MKHRALVSFTAMVIPLLLMSAANAADGSALYNQRGCVACHGVEGNQPINPNFPKLAGQNKGYLVQQINDIKSGARDNGLTAQMKGIVQAVSDEEIDAIADYLSKL